MSDKDIDTFENGYACGQSVGVKIGMDYGMGVGEARVAATAISMLRAARHLAINDKNIKYVVGLLSYSISILSEYASESEQDSGAYPEGFPIEAQDHGSEGTMVMLPIMCPYNKGKNDDSGPSCVSGSGVSACGGVCGFGRVGDIQYVVCQNKRTEP